jgi:hypothetical protein
LYGFLIHERTVAILVPSEECLDLLYIVFALVRGDMAMLELAISLVENSGVMMNLELCHPCTRFPVKPKAPRNSVSEYRP